MRVRIRHTKVGKVRFLGHRDVARLWERAWRKAEIPIAYSEGFSPRPKMHFGLALSTGYESLGEYLDVDVPDDARFPDGSPVVAELLPDRLGPALPPGIEVQRAAVVAPGTASLQEAVTSCTWDLVVTGADHNGVVAATEAMLAADTVEVARERKGKTTTDDIRPYVQALAVTGTGPDGTRITAELGTQPRGLRPAELVDGLSTTSRPTAPLRALRVWRTHQWISPDGARQEPLALPATWAPHAEPRAS